MLINFIKNRKQQGKESNKLVSDLIWLLLQLSYDQIAHKRNNMLQVNNEYNVL